jgi:hypothetical protein
MTKLLQTLVSIGISACACGPLHADWRDQVGYSRLQQLLGSDLPLAPVRGFAQVEASLNAEVPTFEPSVGNANYAGKAFSHRSGESAVSSHADAVAAPFYGNTTSLVSGDCPVDLYWADEWLESNFLQLGSEIEPSVEHRVVQNHSWIATDLEEAEVEEVSRRLDFAIDRDGFSCAVGVNNGHSTHLPDLLCQSYHTISVGLTSGHHSAGLTRFDTAGRSKPDLVAPAGFTSFATPMVASAAGLLHSKLSATDEALSPADQTRVVKALLLASATKNSVASWSNSPSSPLDSRYGAGELNIHHAYRTLVARRTASSSSVECGTNGWSAESVTSLGTQHYFFTIPDGPAPPFSAALTWHRQLASTPSPGGRDWTATLANLNLRLCHAVDFTLAETVAESSSSVDNVELIYHAGLPPGRYALVVENLSDIDSSFALAWHSLPAVSVTATHPEAREIDGHPATVTISRTGDTSLPLLLPLEVGGDAVAGSEFVALPASTVIPAGQSSITLQITPISDQLAQGDRSVTVGIGADFALIRDATQVATLTLRDKPFDAWRFAHFTPQQLADPAASGETADPDGDQLANLIEYALGSDPRTSNPSSVAVSTDAGFLTLSAAKNEAATDVIWAAEISEDLSQWEAAAVEATPEPHFLARDSVLLGTTPRRFIRLKITRL